MIIWKWVRWHAIDAPLAVLEHHMHNLPLEWTLMQLLYVNCWVVFDFFLNFVIKWQFVYMPVIKPSLAISTVAAISHFVLIQLIFTWNNRDIGVVHDWWFVGFRRDTFLEPQQPLWRGIKFVQTARRSVCGDKVKMNSISFVNHLVSGVVFFC